MPQFRDACGRRTGESSSSELVEKHSIYNNAQKERSAIAKGSCSSLLDDIGVLKKSVKDTTYERG